MFFFLFANALAFFHELRVYLCTFTPSFLFIFLSFSPFLIFLLLTKHKNEVTTQHLILLVRCSFALIGICNPDVYNIRISSFSM